MNPLSAEEKALVSATMSVVDEAVRTFAPRFKCLQPQELKGAGYEALVQSAKRYNAELGPFATFARRRVYGAVLDAAYDVLGWRRRGLDLVRGFRDCQPWLPDPDAEQSLEALVARADDDSRAEVVESLSSRALSFCMFVTVQDPPHLEDSLIERESHARFQNALMAAVEQLPADERKVIVDIYWNNRTHAELAGDLKVSNKTIQRLAERARRKLSRRLASLKKA